jgi:endonuclease/exonuclease/phosphatase family metal-dependent hydrolase
MCAEYDQSARASRGLGGSTIVGAETMKKPVGLLGGIEVRVSDPLAERRMRLAERVPYLAAVLAPSNPYPEAGPNGVLEVATYNVHRFSGPGGGNRWMPDLVGAVIGELATDVIALQEVLRPFEEEDPLPAIADALGLYLAFVSTRVHRRGELGNAILSRWPLTSVFALDLSFSRLEQRSAIAAQFARDANRVSIVATHLALVDRTRQKQVHELLDHPQLQGPTVLLGDMNAWRRCPATRRLEDELTQLHHNEAWPPSFPAGRPVLALDRVYARGARVASVRSHASASAKKASDHLPVVATVDLNPNGEAH